LFLAGKKNSRKGGGGGEEEEKRERRKREHNKTKLSPVPFENPVRLCYKKKIKWK